jgi:DNA polymerase-3 subunit alpha
MDFLKLRTLTILKNALDSIKKSTGEKIDINRIDFTDEAIFEEFQKGSTTGIFQFESDGMKVLLRGMKPKSIDDLANANALYRPGPLDAKVEDPDSEHFGKTMVEVFVERASGRAKVEYDHPLLEEVQGDSWGVFVFQEQIMRGSVILAGYTKAESDNLRKVVGKKLLDKIPVEREKFISGCLNNPKFIEGCGKKDPRVLAERIWKQIETFGRYGFNAAHSYSYAILAYQSMYMKVYHPTYFMAAVLTSWMGKKIDLIIPYLNECRRMNIKILPPDINQSSSRFEASKDATGIHFGLTGIKGVGNKAVENILELKERHQIRSIVDFITMTSSAVNRTVTSALIKCGAFDFLGYNRKTLLQMAEELIEINQAVKTKITANKKRKNPVADISTFYEPLYAHSPSLLPEFDLEELCTIERELTGFYMKHHPLDGLIEYIRSKSTNNSVEINKGIKIDRPKADPIFDEDGFSLILDDEDDESDDDSYEPLPRGQTVITGGVIKDLKEIVIKNGRSAGKVMVSFVIEDAYQGDIKCTAFHETYTKFKSVIRKGNVIFIKGNIDYYMDAAQINVNEAKEISRDIANKYNNNKEAEDISREIAEIEDSIKLAEETIELLGTDDYELISEVCAELLRLYNRKDELYSKQKEVVVA